jgi:hypothetical protein
VPIRSLIRARTCCFPFWAVTRLTAWPSRLSPQNRCYRNKPLDRQGGGPAAIYPVITGETCRWTALSAPQAQDADAGRCVHPLETYRYARRQRSTDLSGGHMVMSHFCLQEYTYLKTNTPNHRYHPYSVPGDPTVRRSTVGPQTPLWEGLLDGMSDRVIVTTPVYALFRLYTPAVAVTAGGSLLCLPSYCAIAERGFHASGQRCIAAGSLRETPSALSSRPTKWSQYPTPSTP